MQIETLAQKLDFEGSSPRALLEGPLGSTSGDRPSAPWSGGGGGGGYPSTRHAKRPLKRMTSALPPSPEQSPSQLPPRAPTHSPFALNPAAVRSAPRTLLEASLTVCGHSTAR